MHDRGLVRVKYKTLSHEEVHRIRDVSLMILEKIGFEVDRKMFEPERQGINCPNCIDRKIYLDYKIGYYCMSCGRTLSIKEMLMILERKVCQIDCKKH